MKGNVAAEAWNQICDRLEKQDPTELLNLLISTFRSEWRSAPDENMEVFRLKALCVLSRKLGLAVGDHPDSVAKLEGVLDFAATSGTLKTEAMN